MKWLFPNKKLKRNVEVRVDKYEGAGVHYYVHMIIEPNKYLKDGNWEAERYFGIFSCSGMGISTRKFDTSQEAKEHIKRMIKEFLPSNNFRIIWVRSGQREWFYKNLGD